MKKKSDNIPSEWDLAQAALEAAQKLPRGAERVKALKKAGQMRFEADQRRRNTEKQDPE